jgi:hypothetical protein
VRFPTSPSSAKRVTAPHARLIRRAALWLTSLILLASALGLLTALGDLGLAGASRPAVLHRINEDVHTSFGIVNVEFVRQVDGVTHRALSGASHGISGLVDADHAQIQVAVAITNRVSHPISYKAQQFRLLAIRGGKTIALGVQAGDLPNSRVLPNAGIEGHLDFTVPRGVTHLTLEFRDPGANKPVLIDLGSTRAPSNHGKRP